MITIAHTPLLAFAGQVVRGNGDVRIGQLLYKNESSTTISPTSRRPKVSPAHWMVLLQTNGDNWEEDVSEHMLGRVIDPSSDNVSEGSTVPVDRPQTRSAAAVAKSMKTSVGMKKKTVPPKVIKAGKTVVKPRRAAVPQTPTADAAAHKHTTRAATRSGGSSVELFGGIEDVVLPPKPRTQKKASKEEETRGVTKIQMLTGTLYLYRNGPQRRAEFVRTK